MSRVGFCKAEVFPRKEDLKINIRTGPYFRRSSKQWYYWGVISHHWCSPEKTKELEDAFQNHIAKLVKICKDNG